jgi:hypothetical protein
MGRGARNNGAALAEIEWYGGCGGGWEECPAMIGRGAAPEDCAGVGELVV